MFVHTYTHKRHAPNSIHENVWHKMIRLLMPPPPFSQTVDFTSISHIRSFARIILSFVALGFFFFCWADSLTIFKSDWQRFALYVFKVNFPISLKIKSIRVNFVFISHSSPSLLIYCHFYAAAAECHFTKCVLSTYIYFRVHRKIPKPFGNERQWIIMIREGKKGEEKKDAAIQSNGMRKRCSFSM